MFYEKPAAHRLEEGSERKQKAEEGRRDHCVLDARLPTCLAEQPPSPRKPPHPARAAAARALPPLG